MNLPNGVLYGEQLTQLFQYLKKEKIALPAVNTTGTNTINAALEVARRSHLPIIIQISHGGAAFLAGKSLDNTNSKASIFGAVSMALHVHNLAKLYNVSVILHTDHCPFESLSWVDGLLKVNQNYHNQYNRPLFSSHMLDLSTLPLEKNVELCSNYLEKFQELDLLLEFELGITGGEEDGIDNSGQNKEKLYTTPQDVSYAYEKLSPISTNFTIAASFGNVHGVYAPGNVELKPKILKDIQTQVQTQFNLKPNPLNLVFHGGSGSEPEKVREAVSYGVVKFNIDTDTQWAFWNGVREYETKNHDYLQGQLGNPEGLESPNKDYYDPRKWLRAGELEFIQRLEKAYEELKA